MATEFPEILNRLFEEEIKRVTLPNDLSILLKEEYASQLVSLQFWVKTGSIHEGHWLGAGLSHYIEHLLFKGTESRSGMEITRTIQESGGYINAYTTFDRTVYYIVAPCEQLELMLDVLSDILFNSVLNQEDVNKERDVILREIAMGNDDPDRRVSQALFKTAFRKHPYRYPVIGNQEVFTELSRADLLDYYKSRYVPNNMTVVLVGDFEYHVVIPLLESKLGSYPQKRLAPIFIPEEPVQLAGRCEHLKGDVQVCRAGSGFKIPHLAHPDAPVLDMLAAILGAGHSSLLWRELRNDMKLVHAIDASSWNPGSAGLFWISFLCEPEKYGAAQTAILNLLRRVKKTGFDAALLEKSRRQALVSEINLRKTVSGLASRIGLAEVVVGELEYIERYFRRLYTITPDDLMDALGRYIVVDSMSAVSFNKFPANSSSTLINRKKRILQDFESLTLDNGAKILWQQDKRIPKVHLRYVGLGGPVYEKDEERGVTGVMATLLNRDTTLRSASEIAMAIESKGGVFTEFVGNNTFGLAIEVLKDDLGFACEILHHALVLPAFREETFLVERGAQSAQIREDMDDIVEYGKKLLRKRFFGTNPYAIDAFGKLDSVDGLSIQSVRDCYGRICLAKNTVLSVVGDLNPDRDLKKIEAILDGVSNNSFERVNPRMSGPANIDIHRAPMAREQAVVFMAMPDAGVRSPDFHCGEILEELFSEMSGSLFMRVRDELGLAYFVGAQRVTGLDYGMFYFYAGTRPDSVDRVWKEINNELNKVRNNGLSAEELKRCQTRLKVQKRTSRQSIGSCAMQTALDVTFSMPLNNWKHYDERIDSLTCEQVREFACRYLTPQHSTGLIVGPF